jgi:hypothetical protein
VGAISVVEPGALVRPETGMMTYQEFLKIVSRKANEEWGQWAGRQGWEHGFIWSQWHDRLKWIITPPVGEPVSTDLPPKYKPELKS